MEGYDPPRRLADQKEQLGAYTGSHVNSTTDYSSYKSRLMHVFISISALYIRMAYLSLTATVLFVYSVISNNR